MVQMQGLHIASGNRPVAWTSPRPKCLSCERAQVAVARASAADFSGSEEDAPQFPGMPGLDEWGQSDQFFPVRHPGDFPATGVILLQ